MGYIVELNTLLRPPANFDFQSLQLKKRYTVSLDRERAFPLHIAILVVDKDWKFYGYAVAHSATIMGGKTIIDFEMLTLFSLEQQAMYTENFIAAGKQTGEIA